LAAAKAIGVPFAWMANKYPATYVSKGVDWSNLSIDYIKDGINESSKAIHTIDSFVDKGIKLSVYTVDDEAHMNYYVGQKGKLKAITTNYPAKLINKF
jgi:glycerophosphoryl diester phosphodiesterase